MQGQKFCQGRGGGHCQIKGGRQKQVLSNVETCMCHPMTVYVHVPSVKLCIDSTTIYHVCGDKGTLYTNEQASRFTLGYIQVYSNMYDYV